MKKLAKTQAELAEKDNVIAANQAQLKSAKVEIARLKAQLEKAGKV